MLHHHSIRLKGAFIIDVQAVSRYEELGSIDFFHICWVVHRTAFTRTDRSLATANSDASRELEGKVIKAIRTELTFPAGKLEITFKTDSHEVNVTLISAQRTVYQTSML